MGYSRLLKWLLALAAIIFVGWFVWPTRYRYDRIKMGQTELPVRIDRITSKAEGLYPDGWRFLGAKQETETAKELPREELSKVTGECSTWGSTSSYIDCELMNSSNWVIDSVRVEVVVKNADNSVARIREYDLTRDSHSSGKPLRTSRFFSELGFTFERGQTWSWSIVGAKGNSKNE